MGSGHNSWDYSSEPTAVPTGTIHAFGGATAPSGYLMCDGTSYLRADHQALFNVIGAAFGAADTLHFNVPDLRGRFLRGQDEAQARDPDAVTRTAMATGGNTGDNIGSVQLDKMQGHRHEPLSPATSFYSQAVGTTNLPSSTPTAYAAPTTGNPVTDTVNGVPRTGAETRPLNACVRFIIKT